MSIVHLYDNLAGSWGPAAAAGQQYTIGTIFSSSDADQINALRWYRAGTGAGYAPTRVTLWDTTTASAVADPTVVDSGLVGWQTCPLDAPFTLVGGRVYRLTQTIATGVAIARVASGSRGTPPAPLAWGSAMRCYSAGNTYPTNTDNADALGVDIALDTASGSPGPAPGGDALTVAQLRSEFSDWLSGTGSENFHQTATAWQTWQDALTWLARGGEITNSDAAAYSLRDATLAGAAVKILDYLITNGSNINGLISALNTVKGWLGTNGSAPSGWDMYGQIQDMSTQIYAIKAKVDAMTVPVAPSSWVSLGTMGFTTDLAWAQAADVYTVTYSDLGSATVNLTIGAVDIAYRLLWWAIWDGERMRDRRFADGTLPVLYDGGARMPGIVLHSPAGASGTVEAWTLT